MTRSWRAASLAAAMMMATGAAWADGTRVLVIPFSAINVPESQQWITHGVQESLVADFGRAGVGGANYSPVAFQGKVVVEDNATAARLAQQASTALVVRGSVQVVGAEVRLTAQLIDAKTENTVSTASATGPATDLLKLEDEVSAQLRGVAGAATAGMAGGTGAAPQTVQPVAGVPPVAQPQIVIVMPQQTATYPDYSAGAYYAPYPEYLGFGSIYPGFYPAIFTSVVFTPAVHHHDHDGSGFHNGGGGGGGDFRLTSSTGPSGGPLTITPASGGVLPTSAASFGRIPFSPPLPQVSAPVTAMHVGGMRQGH